MTMQDYLLDHAKRNIWCTPNQDTQFRFAPHRVTVPRGVTRSVSIGHETYNLPNSTDRFHVYQFGQMSAGFIGLIEETGRWRPVSNICRLNNMLIDIYYENGVQLPRYESWIVQTPNKAILLAVKEQSNIMPAIRNNVTLTDTLYVRLYSNAFFETTRHLQPYTSFAEGQPDVNINHAVYVTGKTIETPQDIVDMAQLFVEQLAKPGHAYAVINGYCSNTVSALTVTIGDTVEIIYDSTVEWLVNLNLSDLPSFQSTLDAKAKYLVTFKNALNASRKLQDANERLFNANTIYYQDDIEIFLYKDMGNSRRKGVLYHRNAEDAIRMLTHRDYSLPVGYLDAYVDNANLWTQPGQIKVQLCLRLSGYTRSLIEEASHISELYRYFDPNRAPVRPLNPTIDEIKDIMTGVESTVPFWQAAALEAASYPKVMRKYEQFITPEMVVDALGYHSLSKSLGNPLAYVETIPAGFTGETEYPHYIDIPPLSQAACSVFMYKGHGRMQLHSPWSFLDRVYTNVTGNRFFLPTQDIPVLFETGLTYDMAEIVPGIASKTISQYSGKQSYVIPIECEFRCYKSPIGPFGTTNVWSDITASNDYIVTNNPDGVSKTINFTVNTGLYDCCVKTSERFLWYDYTVDFEQDGLMAFSIDCIERRNDTDNLTIMHIPPAKLEIWMEDYRLIESIDYTLKWPQIVVHSANAYRSVFDRRTAYGLPTSPVTFKIRATGFCNADMTMPATDECGLIDNHVISKNGRFNIRDTSTNVLFMNGGIVHRKKLDNIPANPKISEIKGSAPEIDPDTANWSYQFQRHVIPLPNLPGPKSPLTLRLEDESKEKVIADYISQKYPELPDETPSYAKAPYVLFSPFFTKVYSDMKAGQYPGFVDIGTNDPTDQQILAELEEQEWILQYDPAKVLREDLKGRVRVVTTPFFYTQDSLSVTIKEFAFLHRINTLYFDGKLAVNDSFVISN